MIRASVAGTLLLTLFGFFLTQPMSVFADAVSDLQAQIDAHTAQIAQLNADIAAYQKQVDALGAKKNTLQSTISGLALSAKQLGSQIQVTQNKIASANLQIRQLTLSIGDKETTIAADQTAIAKALRSIAQDEEMSLVVKFISSESLGNAWKVADQAVQFNRALADDIRDLRDAKTVLASNRDQVSAKKNQLVSLNTDLSTQKRSVDANAAAQKQLLAETKNQESSYQKLIAQKKAEEAAFEATLFALESELKYVLDTSRIPAAGKGVLRWPLDSVFVTQQFGKTSDSKRLYASGTHNGVDFRAAIGTPIRAAYSGTVLGVNYGAVRNCQYGKWVLIKHPNGIATLYAHLSDISVEKGATVTVGQVIGFAGNTGYAIGPHLHFTVYIADAVSFKQYTCWNKSVVTIPIAPVNAYLDPLSYL